MFSTAYPDTIVPKIFVSRIALLIYAQVLEVQAVTSTLKYAFHNKNFGHYNEAIIEQYNEENNEAITEVVFS